MKENPTVSKKKMLLKPIIEFNKVTEHKIRLQKLIFFLVMNNWNLKFIKIGITIASEI